MQSFSEYLTASEKHQLEEGPLNFAKSAIAGVGNMGSQFGRGLGNIGKGAWQSATGVNRFDPSRVGQGIATAAGGVAQAGLSPLSGVARGWQALNQSGLGKPDAQPGAMGNTQQFFGLANKPTGVTNNEPIDNQDQSLQAQDQTNFDRKQWSASASSLLKQLSAQGPKGFGGWIRLKQISDEKLAQLKPNQPAS